MTWLIMIEILVGSGLAIASLAWIIPSSNTSKFRYRLWQMRDELYDDLEVGAFQDPRCAESFKSFVEQTILMSSEMTMLRLWLIHVFYPKPPNGSMPAFLDRGALCTNDCERIERYMARYQSIFYRHLIFGTPSGWVATFILLPTAIGLDLHDAVKDRAAVSVGGIRSRARKISSEHTASPDYVLKLNAGRLAGDAGSRLAHQM